MSTKHKLIWLTLFAIAMAHVEASLVVYLRELYYPANPLALFPLALFSDSDFVIELGRELATVVMILSIALLVERGLSRRFAAFVYIFGLWDIFYYLWLKLMLGWPVGWLDWDVLFLIPWPWIGPWLSPVLIALLFVVWGVWILVHKTTPVFNRLTASVFVIGCLQALASFLLPVVPLLAGGKAAFLNFQPEHFPWLLFGGGYLLMVLSLWTVAKGQA